MSQPEKSPPSDPTTEPLVAWLLNPPTSLPKPEQFVYARKLRTDLAARVEKQKGIPRKNTASKLSRINAWLKAANQLASFAESLPVGLDTMENILIEVTKLLSRVRKQVGLELTGYDLSVHRTALRLTHTLIETRSGRTVLPTAQVTEIAVEEVEESEPSKPEPESWREQLAQLANSCTTKKRYSTAEIAKTVAARIPGRLRSYPCNHCGGYHLTKQRIAHK